MTFPDTTVDYFPHSLSELLSRLVVTIPKTITTPILFIGIFVLASLILAVLNYITQQKYIQTLPSYNEIPNTILSHMASKSELQKLNDEGGVDIAIIGSGIGALTSASLLSKCGYKVVVFEQHYTAGGSTHVYKDSGYEFDVGVHYVGGNLDLPWYRCVFRWMFDIISDSKLRWNRIAENYDVAYNTATGERMEFTGDAKMNRKTLLIHFPSMKKEALDLYYKKCKQARAVAWIAFALKAFPPFLTRVVWEKMNFGSLYHRVCLRKTQDVMKECGIPEDATGGICYSYGDYGTPPGESPFFSQAFMQNHYDRGAFFPQGGSQSIAKTLIASIKRRGGIVYTASPVEKILTTKSTFHKCYKATGVRVKGIDIKVNRAVISNAGFVKTFEVDTNGNSPLVEQVAGASQLALVHHKEENTPFRPSPSFVCLFVGLDGSDKELHLPGQNIWHLKNWDHTKNFQNYNEGHPDIDAALEDDPPLVFLSNESAKDPDYNKRHPGKSTVTIIALTNPKWFQEWHDKPHNHRGEHYIQIKEKIKTTLLNVLYQHFPLTRGKVNFAELGTPLSADKYLGRSGNGEIYNLDHNTGRFDSLGAQLALHPQTSIRNLYLTGQDVIAVSVLGATISGFVTAARISLVACIRYGIPGLVLFQSWVLSAGGK